MSAATPGKPVGQNRLAACISGAFAAVMLFAGGKALSIGAEAAGPNVPMYRLVMTAILFLGFSMPFVLGAVIFWRGKR